MPFGALTAVSNGYAVSLPTKRANHSRVSRAILNEEGVPTRLPDLALPPHLVTRGLALHGPFLYVGGDFDERGRPAVEVRPAAGRFDLRVEQPTWEPLELPIPPAAGKAIDDVLVEGDELILVDNILFPKYLFVYRLAAGNALPHSPRVIELPFARVNEHIHKGQVSPDYVALYSTSTGMGGTGTYVSVLRRGEYSPCLEVAYEEAAEESWTPWTLASGTEFRSLPFDIALHDHTLVIACPQALACIDLRAVETAALPGPLDSPHATIPPSEFLRIDLRDATPVSGLRWLDLGPEEDPDAVQFVGPNRLLLTTSDKQATQQAWLKAI
ncbi:hypothetical protein SAMN04515668_2505 [Hymenobacter arizonensis]|uniref:Uncharacterized protein n=1 Tax=Hymenobacter arizonensis TaxID=1227077 RepID=A0A1I5YXT7_HYMAR|nr:hypothetical protein SAMN04515668_2505 [Hymenobacter arizonensis]